MNRGRPTIQENGECLEQTSVRLTARQKTELARRGGSAYLRRVLDTAMIPTHKPLRGETPARRVPE